MRAREAGHSRGAAPTPRTAQRSPGAPSAGRAAGSARGVVSAVRAGARSRGSGSSGYGRGLVCALAGASLWGVSGACAQFLLEGYAITPAFITATRAVIAAVLFAVLLTVRYREQASALLRDRVARRGTALFGVALFLSQFTFAASVGATNAGTATVLQSLGIAFIMVIACVRGRKAPCPRETAGLVCALAATWLIATQGDVGALRLPVEGLVWGLVNALSVTFYIMYPRRLYARFESLPVIGCGMAASAIVSVAVWLAGGLVGAPIALPALDAAGMLVLVAGVGVLGTFVAFGLYLRGVAAVGPVAGGLLGAVEPASATLVVVAWLGTAMSVADVAGLALMVAMIVLVSAAPPREGS